MESLPKSYDAWRTATPYDDEPDHLRGCPCHEDSDVIWSKCGGHNECLCSLAIRELGECEEIEPECICPSSEELEAEAAEARQEARNDR